MGIGNTKFQKNNKNGRIILPEHYEVIDNFLPDEDFEVIQNLFLPKYEDEGLEISLESDGNRTTVNTEQHYIPWIYSTNIGFDHSAETETVIPEDRTMFFMSHNIYVDNFGILSSIYPYFRPVLDKLGVKALKRIRCNLFPNTKSLYVHEFHTDFHFSHNAALLSINTCDGFTTLEDGTKIDSVANRVLIIDGSTSHASSTTSNEAVRINVNISYF